MAPQDVFRESPEPVDRSLHGSRNSVKVMMLRIVGWISYLWLSSRAQRKEGTEGPDRCDDMWFWRVGHLYLGHCTWKRHWNRGEERGSGGGGGGERGRGQERRRRRQRG